MVCVAAVALGLSTYAWFVSNNNVDAITTDISAQFNSAYLVIQEATADKTATDNTSESSATATEAVTNQYAHKDTFYIGTGGYDGSFTNLKVENVKVSDNSITATLKTKQTGPDASGNWIDKEDKKSEIKLVKNGNTWLIDEINTTDLN